MKISKDKDQKLFVWRREINLFGNKMMLETSGAKKMWGVKIYESYKSLHSVKFQFMSTKVPNILKVLILTEICGLVYTNILKKFMVGNYEALNNKIMNSPIYDVFKFQKPSDNITNIFIYSTLGKILYLQNKRKFYFLLGVGGIFSCGLYYFGEKLRKKIEDNMKIEDFYIYNPSPNIIPKLFLATSILNYLNFFLRNDYLKLFGGLAVEKKALFMFFWIYTISKISQFFSNFVCEGINMASVDGVLSILISSLFINKSYLLFFITLFYINPYSFAIWLGGKNHTEEDFLKDNYSIKSYHQRIATYFKYITLVGCSNMLKIYF